MRTRRRFIASSISSAFAALAGVHVQAASAATAIIAPILMYHNVSPNLGGRFNVTPAAFEEQMAWLAQNGYSAVSVTNVARAILSQIALPAKPVAITFDDGWRSQIAHAVPVLDKYGYKATFYVVANYVVPSKSLMGWSEFAALLADGHALGSHSARHDRETTMGPAALQADLAAAPTAIKKNLGYVVRTHAYPYGATNAMVQAATRSAGFMAAVGVGGSTRHTSAKLFNLGRVEVRGGLSLAAFAGLVRR